MNGKTTETVADGGVPLKNCCCDIGCFFASSATGLRMERFSNVSSLVASATGLRMERLSNPSYAAVPNWFIRSTLPFYESGSGRWSILPLSGQFSS